MYTVHRSSHVPSCRSLGVVLALMIASAFGGCKRQPFACVPVSGKVTYEDGSLITADRIRVTFLSQTPAKDPKVHPRQGAALVDVKTGAFDSVTTYVPRDGIVPGEHKVLIECFSGRELRTDLVPDEYANPEKTPLTVDSSNSPFDFKVRKPK